MFLTTELAFSRKSYFFLSLSYVTTVGFAKLGGTPPCFLNIICYKVKDIVIVVCFEFSNKVVL